MIPCTPYAPLFVSDATSVRTLPSSRAGFRRSDPRQQWVSVGRRGSHRRCVSWCAAAPRCAPKLRIWRWILARRTHTQPLAPWLSHNQLVSCSAVAVSSSHPALLRTALVHVRERASELSCRLPLSCPRVPLQYRYVADRKAGQQRSEWQVKFSPQGPREDAPQPRRNISIVSQVCRWLPVVHSRWREVRESVSTDSVIGCVLPVSGFVA